MKRWLINLGASISVLVSLAAAAAWAMSHARPVEWHLLGIAHSADLARLDVNPRTVVFMVPVHGTDMGSDRGSNVAHHGFWDALWARSQSGRLTLVAQTIDYEGSLRRVYASPPSLIVDLTYPVGARAVVFERMPDSRPWARPFGFAWETDVQHVADDRDVAGEPASVQARLIMLPYWFIVLLGLPLSLLWLRVHRRSRRAAAGGPVAS